MTTTRVAVTGMAGLTSLGHDYDSVIGAMNAGRSGIRFMEEWARYDGLNTHLGAPIADFALPEHYPRKKIRSMGRVASLAVVATERALGDAGLLAPTSSATAIAASRTARRRAAPTRSPTSARCWPRKARG